MKKRTKLIASSLSIITCSSFLVFSSLTHSNNFFQNHLILNKNDFVADPDNNYLINLKSGPELNYQEKSSDLNYNEKFNLLAVDNKYVEAKKVTDPVSGAKVEENHLIFHIDELNKYDVGEQEFIESLSFNLRGGFFSFNNKENNNTKKYFDFTDGEGESPKMPFSFSFPENFKPEENNPIFNFPDQEFKIEIYDEAPKPIITENQKYLSILIKASYDSNNKILDICPQIKALNNDYKGTPYIPLSFNMEANQDMFLEISSPFIWKDQDVILDEYVSAQVRLAHKATGDINITNPLNNVSNAFEEFTFSTEDNNQGVLVNKSASDKPNQNAPIYIDLRNHYYSDEEAMKNSFDLIFSNFKIKELSNGKDEYIDYSKGQSYPLRFSIKPDPSLAIGDNLLLEHFFLQDDKGGFIKMELNLIKEGPLLYRIAFIKFSTNGGNEDINYLLSLPKINDDFFSLIVKPANFSAIKALQEIKNINAPENPIEIPSSYSSDVFDDTFFEGQAFSNFSLVKKELDLKLKKLFASANMQKMGASLEEFNYPVYSYEYLNPADFSSGYGILKIASLKPNHFIPKIELKILFRIQKSGFEEVVEISLKKSSNQKDKTLLALEAEKYQDLDIFISDLNKKSNYEKLTYFSVRSKIEDDPAVVLKEEAISFSAYFLNGVKQQGALLIKVPLEENYSVISNGQKETEFKLIVKDLNLFYSAKSASDIEINEELLAAKAKNFTSFETFYASEKDNVKNYLITNNFNQIEECFFEADPDNKNAINIRIKIYNSFEFDNFTQEKVFEIGNIFWNGEVPNLKAITLSLNYSTLANYAATKNDPEELISEFNKNWALILNEIVEVSEEEKKAISKMKISSTDNMRSFLVSVSLKSGYYFSDQSFNNLTKTFSIINIRFNSEPTLNLNFLDLEINFENLIYYIKDFKDLKSFLAKHSDKFLIENDNNNSIIRMNHYYRNAISKIKVSTNLQNEIIIDLETKSGYYFDSYNNPYYQIIITIDDIKNAYDDLNDNNNSYQVDFDIYYSLLQNDAKNYLNMDEFLLYLNENQNMNKYIKEKKGNIFAIKKMSLEKKSNNSFLLTIFLKDKYSFINLDSENNTSKEFTISNISFKDETLELKKINLKLDIASFVKEANKYKNFDDFNNALTLEKKISFLIFIAGDKEAINSIILEKNKDEHSINFKIILKEGFYFADQNQNDLLKEIIINNIYYDGQENPNLKAIKIAIKGNDLLAFVKNFANFKSLAAVLNKKEELLKYLDFISGDEQAIESLFIYRGEFWNDFYLQINLKGGYYFEGESKNKAYKNILISNVRYLGDKEKELQEIRTNFNFDFFFELLLNFDKENLTNFSKENYQYMLNFTNNKAIIQLSPLNAKLIQSAIMYQDSTGFYFEIKFADGVFWDMNNKWNPYYQKFLSFEEIKIEHQNYLSRLAARQREKDEAITLIIVLSSIGLVTIIATIVIVKVVKKKKKNRRIEEQ
ncbi:MAG: hypothetical protein ACRCRZ_01160 [Metamycoplasmataceae bacterium]